MRRHGRILGIAAAVLLVTSLTQAAPRQSVWRTDYENALKAAKAEGKPLVLHFHASWCGPCREMERNVLFQPNVLGELKAGVIGVMVDSDDHPDLVRRYRVEALPCDVFLDPDGRIVRKDSGYRDRGVYVSRVSDLRSRYHSDKTVAAQASRSVGEGQQSHARRTDPVRTLSIQPFLALEGYSPVALSAQRKWVKGRADFAAEYRGVLYYLSSARELETFNANPQRYAPQLLGCDPVLLWKSDRAVRGSTRFGAFFDGRLYLFATRDSREEFKTAPLRYTQTRHVLKIDASSGTVRR
jgi:YHS domain-containing protein/thiol-disulfide isomerase/thioredoxin